MTWGSDGMEYKNNNKNLINNMNKIQTPTLKFLEYYKDAVAKRCKENTDEVIATATELRNGSALKKHNWLSNKIENHLKRQAHTLPNETTASVLQQIIDVPLVASFLAKDPTKQNLSEKLQIKFNQRRGIELEKVRGSGPNAIRICDGKVIKGNKNSNTTKSIDFRWGNFYVYAKVTTTSGGGQTNQKDDALKFTEEAYKYGQAGGDKQFIILLDGDYYTPTILKEFDKYKTKNIRITNSDKLYQTLTNSNKLR